MVDFSRPVGDDLDDVYQIYVETTPPTIGTITSNVADGETYGIGAQIPIIVNFINGAGSPDDEEVTLNGGGELVIELDTSVGGTDGTVRVSTISDATSTAVTDYYTVVEDDDSFPNLSVNGLEIDGGTITDDYGNEMVILTIPDGGNLDDYLSIDIEATRPRIEKIYSIPDDGTFGIGDLIVIAIKLSLIHI